MLLPLSLIFVFLVGASVGSFLNVAIARLPLEKSLIWPSSRCGACLQAIRWHDNCHLRSAGHHRSNRSHYHSDDLANIFCDRQHSLPGRFSFG